MGRSVDRSVGRSVGWLARIISGLKETFIKRYIVEKTNEAEIRLEEQSEKYESCRENLWNELVSWCFEPSQQQRITSGLTME